MCNMIIYPCALLLHSSKSVQTVTRNNTMFLMSYANVFDLFIHLSQNNPIIIHPHYRQIIPK